MRRSCERQAGGCVLGSEHRCKSGNMQLFFSVSVWFCEAVRDGSNRKIPGDGVDMTTLELTLALDWVVVGRGTEQKVTGYFRRQERGRRVGLALPL